MLTFVHGTGNGFVHLRGGLDARHSAENDLVIPKREDLTWAHVATCSQMRYGAP